jgi:hypothetical protein
VRPCLAFAIAVVALTAFPTAAAAPPFDLVRAFVRFCGETHADANAAVARADADGWKTPSIGSLAALMPGVASSNLQARTLKDADGVTVLLAGMITGKRPQQKVCAVARRGADAPADAARQAIMAWAGVPPLAKHNGPGLVAFSFREAPNGHQPAPAGYDPLAGDAPKVPLASTLILMQVSGLSIIIYTPSGG